MWFEIFVYYFPLLIVTFYQYSLKIWYRRSALKSPSESIKGALYYYLFPLFALWIHYQPSLQTMGISTANWALFIGLGLLVGFGLRFGDTCADYGKYLWEHIRCACLGKGHRVKISATIEKKGFIFGDIVIGGLLIPVVEEVLDRALVYSLLAIYLPIPAAILLVSVDFATMHQMNYDDLVWHHFFVYGLVYTLLFQWTGTLLASCTAHIAFNLFVPLGGITNYFLNTHGLELPGVTYYPMPASVHGLIPKIKSVFLRNT